MRRIETLGDLEQAIEEYGFLPYHGDHRQLLFTMGGMTDNDWHDDSDTDPWLWRARIAQKGEQAYGKFFLKRSGFIARRCLPAFIAVRRENRSFEELYEEGLASRRAKQVYDCFEQRPNWTFQDLKREASLEKSGDFEPALVELQMLMFLCVSGQSQRVNKQGEPYGWHTNDFARLDALFPIKREEELSRREGEDYLMDCLRAVGNFPEKAARRLIFGGGV